MSAQSSGAVRAFAQSARFPRNRDIARDVLAGLTADQKFIPSKYLYDGRGSKLFEQICRLPEYYPTRIELALLRRHATELLSDFTEGDLVELGSGANWKIRILLDALGKSRRSMVRYVPVDVSASALKAAAKELVKLYPEIEVAAVVGDFTRDWHRIRSTRPKLVMFFGSTIGNLDEDQTSVFLRGLAECLNPGDSFLLGLDVLKSVSVLEAAYNDSQRVTADFNKNVLLVVNRELAANFDLNDFDHVAFYNEERERVEMHLRAKRDVTVKVQDLGLSISMTRGETILTEICRKFSRGSAADMLSQGGMALLRWFSDPKEWFALAEVVPLRWSDGQENLDG